MPDTDAVAKRIVQEWYVTRVSSIIMGNISISGRFDYRDVGPCAREIVTILSAAALSAARAEENKYPSIPAMKAAVELEIVAAIGIVTTQAVGRLIDQYYEVRLAEFRALSAGQGGENG